MAELTYKSSGVDLEQYADAMSRLPRLMHRTFSPRVIRNDGGFAGLFSLDFAGPLFSRKYEDPALVACTDGVGTKLRVAVLAGKHDTVGIDLVAMCVNDAICCGAEPLFFLDYVALSKDDPALLEQIVSGVAAGCVESDCALIGGETAILPDLYADGDYDLAGFCTGVVERRRTLDGKNISPGDAVIGLASTGIHSNGYSLARKIVFNHAGLKPADFVPELNATVAETLLTPTRIYARAVRGVQRHYRVKQVLHAAAHITGGGLAENLERVLPGHLNARLERGSWPVPAVFPWMQRLGNVADDEMARVFNGGIGFVMVVSQYFAESILAQLADLGYPASLIGRMEAAPEGTAGGKALLS